MDQHNIHPLKRTPQSSVGAIPCVRPLTDRNHLVFKTENISIIPHPKTFPPLSPRRPNTRNSSAGMAKRWGSLALTFRINSIPKAINSAAKNPTNTTNTQINDRLGATFLSKSGLNWRGRHRKTVILLRLGAQKITQLSVDRQISIIPSVDRIQGTRKGIILSFLAEKMRDNVSCCR